MRVLPGGEAVTVDGVHLGHNIPDKKGNRVSYSSTVSPTGFCALDTNVKWEDCFIICNALIFYLHGPILCSIWG